MNSRSPQKVVAAQSYRVRVYRRTGDAACLFVKRRSNGMSALCLLKKVGASVIRLAPTWWGWRGSNPRPLRCERSALTSWATSPNTFILQHTGAIWQVLFFFHRMPVEKQTVFSYNKWTGTHRFETKPAACPGNVRRAAEGDEADCCKNRSNGCC